MQFKKQLILLLLFFVPFSVTSDVEVNPQGYPIISGMWVSNNNPGSETISRYVFQQEGEYLSGQYTDERNNEVLMESQINGYLDKNGNVIFDLYFGKVTVTNRLKLSDDGKNLKGTFTTTMSNKGDVHIVREN